MAVVDRRRSGRTRRAATQWRTAMAKLSCLARNGRAATRGRKLRTAVADLRSRRSAATTAFGQTSQIEDAVGASDRTMGTRRSGRHTTPNDNDVRAPDENLPAHHTRSRAADHHETPDSRSARQPAIAAGRGSGQGNADGSDSHANRRCPVSSARLGREGGRTAPLRSPAQHDETRKKAPPRGGAFVYFQTRRTIMCKAARLACPASTQRDGIMPPLAPCQSRAEGREDRRPRVARAPPPRR